MVIFQIGEKSNTTAAATKQGFESNIKTSSCLMNDREWPLSFGLQFKLLPVKHHRSKFHKLVFSGKRQPGELKVFCGVQRTILLLGEKSEL